MRIKKETVGIDCRALTGEMTGGGYYTYNLVKNILKIDRERDYLLFAHKSFERGLDAPNSRKVINRGFSGLLWQNTALPLMLRREKVDIFHSPLFTLPPGAGCPAVITVFDLTPVIYPQFHRFKVRLSFMRLRASAEKAEKIIAISENTRRDILEYLRVDSEKVEVIYPGVGGIFKPGKAGDAEEARTRYAGGKKYLLHAGTIEPRKNLLFLIDVYREILRRGHDDLDLVIAGARGWGCGDVFRKAREPGMEGRIHFPGYVPRDELPRLYSSSEMLVYCSVYEGFGLPLAEAMACGAPVIAFSGSSMPEVVGDAGLLMGGWSPPEWAESIEVILRNDKIRRGFAEKGVKKAARFSWAECARRTVGLYGRVLNR